MLGTTDWAAIFTGIGTIISAVFAGLAALMANRTHQQVQTPNGDPRTVGEVVTDVAEKVGAGHETVSTSETPKP